ncbi:hypothetical protein [Streptomyces sp. NPDC094032]|uniref:hypothetical protein n=1 Tax=Streptomyces sp. NPDC094032 TaxID=3155308 RepID=UPI0033205C62
MLENTTGEVMDADTFVLGMEVSTIYPDPDLAPSLMSLQMRVGGTWRDADLRALGGQRDVTAILPIGGTVVAPGKTTYPMRLKFTKDAPLTEFLLGPRPSTDVNIGPEDYWEASEIVAPSDPEEKPSGEPSEGPSKEPSHEPSREPSKGPSQDPSREPSREPSHSPSQEPTPRPTPTPIPTPTPTPTPSGALAQTGAAQSPPRALGIGGIAVALGAACLVGVRLRRRRQS